MLKALKKEVPIAQAAAEEASPPGCVFLFFWGLGIVKFVYENCKIQATVFNIWFVPGRRQRW
jgi:hypothetical protein